MGGFARKGEGWTEAIPGLRARGFVAGVGDGGHHGIHPDEARQEQALHVSRILDGHAAVRSPHAAERAAVIYGPKVVRVAWHKGRLPGFDWEMGLPYGCVR